VREHETLELICAVYIVFFVVSFFQTGMPATFASGFVPKLTLDLVSPYLIDTIFFLSSFEENN